MTQVNLSTEFCGNFIQTKRSAMEKVANARNQLALLALTLATNVTTCTELDRCNSRN